MVRDRGTNYSPQIYTFPNPGRNRLHLGDGRPETYGGTPGAILPLGGIDTTPIPTTNNTGHHDNDGYTPPPFLQNENEVPESPIGSLKNVDDKWLKGQGIDPHDLKDILPGPAKHFDIYKDKDGNLWGLRKPEYGRNAEPEYLENVKNFK